MLKKFSKNDKQNSNNTCSLHFRQNATLPVSSGPCTIKLVIDRMDIPTNSNIWDKAGAYPSEAIYETLSLPCKYQTEDETAAL